MSHTDVMPAPRHRTRRITVGSIVAAVVLSVFATLLGPLGAVQSADAASNPRWKIGHRDSYLNFIGAIRWAVNSGHDESVPGTGYRIMHTDPAANRRYINVDVEIQHNQRFVTLRLHASDLYLMGWWGGANGEQRYYYLDPDQDMPSNSEAAGFGENYNDLQNAANTNRYDLEYNPHNLDQAVYTLIRGGSRQARAHAVLMMTQAVSGATRFRPIMNYFGLLNDENLRPTRLSAHYVDMQNTWGQGSNRYNELLREHRSDSPDRAYRIWTFNKNTREWIQTSLVSAALYAIYYLQVAKGK
ncbi:ribosome-inactivating family protein [Streptomyces sp. NPDC001401]|uniref:ribosome-inactivating family protein n=1 Tax=Streptomyces sp. NPDC001401 TaxID=3364570 RepID=UPI00367F5AAD